MKLRIGLAEQTLLAALGQAAVYTEKHSTPPPHIQSPLEEVSLIITTPFGIFECTKNLDLFFLVGFFFR